MNAELIETEEVHNAVVSTATNKPVEFSVTDAAIAEMREKFMPLTIAGPTDKAGFQAVYDARMIVKRSRVDVDKKRKELNEDALEWQRKVNGEAKRITAGLTEIETHLELEETAYNNEIKRIADEKAEAERQRYQSRVLQLKDWGFTFDDFFESYVLGTVIILKDDIRDLTDENYAPTVELAKKAVEAEQQRLADEKLKDERAGNRLKQLRAWGFVWDDQHDGYSFIDGLNIEHYTVFSEDLRMTSDEEFEPIASTAKRVYDAEQTRLADIQKEADKLKEANRIEAERLQGIADDQAAAQKLIDDQRKQLEDDRRKMILNGRTPLLEAAGFEFTGNRFKLGTTIKLGQEDIVDMADQQFADLLVDAKAKIKEDTAAKIEADRLEKVRINNEKKANKERTARLAPDKKALKKWAIRLGNFPLAETTQDEASALATSFIGRLSIMANEFAVEIDAL